MCHQAKGNKLFVGGIALDADSSDLGQAFAPFGIESARVIAKNHGDKVQSTGFGIVKFSNAEGLKAAIAGAASITVKGKPIEIKERGQILTRPTDTAIIEGVPEGTTEADIIFALKDYKASAVRIIKTASRRGPGFAIVQFESAEAVEAAVTGVGKFMLKGGESSLSPSRKKFEGDGCGGRKGGFRRFWGRGGFRGKFGGRGCGCGCEGHGSPPAAQAQAQAPPPQPSMPNGDEIDDDDDYSDEEDIPK
jgi:RNA recognition motif-containing protein